MAKTKKISNANQLDMGFSPKYSAFNSNGLRKTIAALVEKIQLLYAEDNTPWIVGYSGGKDSTAVLQLVWMSIGDLEPHQRHKPIYVISTDTLVENPVILEFASRSMDSMKKTADALCLPIIPNRLKPAIEDSFWVNLIGKGYASPRHKFRWCTDRLKIRPSNNFIESVVSANGEAILVLGTRKAESKARAKTMGKYEAKRVRELLSPSGSPPNTLVFSPIENWTNDDVWLFLMQYKSPWLNNNKALLALYSGASPDGECPLVVDTGTPSCGSSRFGCWVCTMVNKDKSMDAMISNDEEKEWLLPLREFRNILADQDDRHVRSAKRRNGRIQIYKRRPIPGSYLIEYRALLLAKLLRISDNIRIPLVDREEIIEIYRIWASEGHCLKKIIGDYGFDFPDLPFVSLDSRPDESVKGYELEQHGFLKNMPDWPAFTQLAVVCWCGASAIEVQHSIVHSAAPAVGTLTECLNGHSFYTKFEKVGYRFDVRPEPTGQA